MSNIIYELSIYSTDFSDKLITQLSSPKLNTISITNKKFNTPILEIIKNIQNINPNLEIIPYYSLKYHQEKSLQDTTKALIKKLETYQKLSIKEILIISGNPKPKYNTIDVLNTLVKLYQTNQYPQIAIAYNPFLTGLELEMENTSIQNKLQSGIVSSVYLQIGIDLMTIKQSIKYLRRLQPQLNIYISLMNPSPTRLAQFRYRPWKGVYLPEEYVKSSNNAYNINQSITKLAKNMKIGIIQGD
ncbi:MAG: hypothetical protein RJB24_375 [Candidatus Parcubacteria bacterium]|jgi:hypothetical protein